MLFATLLIMSSLMLSILASPTYFPESRVKYKTNDKVIIDVDPGIDDIEGLTLCLNEHKRGTFQIVAIIVSEGNTDQVFGIQNTMRFLQAANSLNIPVYSGSRMPILPHKEKLENYFGLDGFGDLSWTTQPPIQRMQRKLGPTAVKELVDKYPHQITYIILGPMTNLALAMRMYDGLSAKLKGVHAMGGLYRDAAGEIGEFNIMFDPESAEIVFDQLQAPMTIFTWQACLKNTPIRIWFENATISNPVFDMILRAEVSLKAIHPTDTQWVSCDPMAIVAFLDHSSILESFESPLQVQLNGGVGRGVITNYTNAEHPGYERHPVTVITEMDMNVMQQVFLRGMSQICTSCKSRCTVIN